MSEQAAVLPLEQPPRAGVSSGWTRHLGRRAVSVGAPALYLGALAVVIASWGLPVARDQLFLWLGLGLLAFSVSAWRSWGGVLLGGPPVFAPALPRRPPR